MGRGKSNSNSNSNENQQQSNEVKRKNKWNDMHIQQQHNKNIKGIWVLAAPRQFHCLVNITAVVVVVDSYNYYQHCFPGSRLLMMLMFLLMMAMKSYAEFSQHTGSPTATHNCWCGMPLCHSLAMCWACEQSNHLYITFLCTLYLV